jgi:hypothetical protein
MAYAHVFAMRTPYLMAAEKGVEAGNELERHDV